MNTEKEKFKNKFKQAKQKYNGKSI